MAGLRAKQKADKTRRILDAAATLFRREGYDSARIEAIAEMAEVSVGTLYNYYQNKGDILVATVAMEVTEVLEGGARIVASPPLDVAEAPRTLPEKFPAPPLVSLPRERGRGAVAFPTRQPEPPPPRRYTELDGQLSAQVVRLVETLQARGVVHAGVDARAIGEVFFNNLNMMFIEFCKVDAMPLEELKARVEAQHAPIARLISTVKIV